MTQAQILIIEDEGIVAKEIQSRLKGLGYTISGVASTGEEAIDKAAETRPDLVLMDIKLQGEMDGVEAAHQIRTRFDIPVVYLTAYADENTLQRAKITKPFGYIIKPFEERELHTTIEISLYNHMMERKLQESEERYRAVSELTSDFAYAIRIEPDGSRVLEWLTEAFTRITGFTPDEMNSPDDLFKLFHPDDLPAFLQSLECYLPEPSESIECRIITKNGEVRWIRGYNRAVWDNVHARVVRIYGAVQNITKRKFAEDLLRVQRDLGIALSSTSDLIEALNRLLEATFRTGGIDCGGLYLVDEVTGGIDLAAHKGLPRQFVDISHYDANSPQVRLVMGGEPIYGHYSEVALSLVEICHSEGLCALAFIPVQYEEQIVAGLILASHTQDEISVSARNALESIAAQIGGIIARIKIENALQESEERLRSTISSLDELLFVLDINGIILDYYQPPDKSDLYAPPEQFVGKSFREVLPPQVVKPLEAAIKAVVANDTVQQFEYTLKIAEKEIWFRAKVSIRRDSSGEFAGATVVTHDIPGPRQE